MSSTYDFMYEGYDEVEASTGFTSEPLPTGWEYFLLEKVLETQLSKNGSPQARVQLLAKEGANKDKRAFVTVTMGPASVDKNGSMRNDEEKKKAANVTKSQMKMFMQALDVNTGQPVGENEQKVFSFYNVGMWEGREFMGYIKLQPARGDYSASNQLGKCVSLEDAKEGLAAWRAKQAGGGAVSAATTI